MNPHRLSLTATPQEWSALPDTSRRNIARVVVRARQLTTHQDGRCPVGKAHPRRHLAPQHRPRNGPRQATGHPPKRRHPMTPHPLSLPDTSRHNVTPVMVRASQPATHQNGGAR